MTAIKYALEFHWGNAVMAIIFSACFDALDGATARLLKATSRFGAELDSLADSVNFGIIPSLIIYIWLKETTSNSFDSYYLGWTWVACTLFTSCCILRLARFNIMDKSINENLASDYFVGVPTPAGAGLLLLPIVAKLLGERFAIEFITEDIFFVITITIWIVIISLLMISNIATISFKKFRFKIHKKGATLILISIMLLITTLLKEFWITIFAVQILYLITIPVFGIMRKIRG